MLCEPCQAEPWNRGNPDVLDLCWGPGSEVYLEMRESVHVASHSDDAGPVGVSSTSISSRKILQLLLGPPSTPPAPTFPDTQHALHKSSWPLPHPEAMTGPFSPPPSGPWADVLLSARGGVGWGWGPALPSRWALPLAGSGPPSPPCHLAPPVTADPLFRSQGSQLRRAHLHPGPLPWP